MITVLLHNKCMTVTVKSVWFLVGVRERERERVISVCLDSTNNFLNSTIHVTVLLLYIMNSM